MRLLHPLPDGKALLTVGETADALGTERRSVLTALARGRFPGAFQTPGGAWRVPVEDVQRIRVENRIDPNVDSIHGP